MAGRKLKRRKAQAIAKRYVFHGNAIICLYIFQLNIYTLPHTVSLETKVGLFQYKLLNNILYLNQMLFKSRKAGSLLRSFCKTIDKTSLKLFCQCHITNQL